MLRSSFSKLGIMNSMSPSLIRCRFMQSSGRALEREYEDKVDKFILVHDTDGLMKYFQQCVISQDDYVRHHVTSSIICALVNMRKTNSGLKCIKAMQKAGVQPNLNAFHGLIRNLSQREYNGEVKHYESALQIYQMMLDFDYYVPNAIIYTLMKMARPFNDQHVLDLYEKRRIPVTNHTMYCIAIMACRDDTNLEKALAIVEDMKREGLEMTISVYNHLSKVVGKTKETWIMEKIVEDVVSHGFEITPTVMRSLLSSAVASSSWAIAAESYEYMRNNFDSIDGADYGKYLVALGYLKRNEEVIYEYEHWNGYLTESMLLVYITALFDVGRYQDVLDTVNRCSNLLKYTPMYRRKFTSTTTMALMKLGRIKEAKAKFPHKLPMECRIACAREFVKTKEGLVDGELCLQSCLHHLHTEIKAVERDVFLANVIDELFTLGQEHNLLRISFQYVDTLAMLNNALSFTVEEQAKLKTTAYPKYAVPCSQNDMKVEIKSWRQWQNAHTKGTLTKPWNNVIKALGTLNNK